MSAMTPSEWLRYMRREHTEVAYPVAHCRKCHLNWPCDVIRAIEASAAAERERFSDSQDEARSEAIEAVDRLENDLAFTAPELYGMRFRQLRERLEEILGGDPS